MVRRLVAHLTEGEDLALEQAAASQLHAWQDGEVILPADQRGRTGFCAGFHRLRLLPCVQLLHHSAEAGHRAQPSGRRNCRRSALAGGAGRERSGVAGPNCGSLWL